MSQESIIDIASYCVHTLGAFRSYSQYLPPLQSTMDPVAPRISTMLRKALPAQALAITGTAKYLRKAKAARIVAECGAGKTYMALAQFTSSPMDGPHNAVMCPSHITHKWAREVCDHTAPAPFYRGSAQRRRPEKAHGICEVKLRKGRIVYEGMRLSLSDLRG